jgi:hypothetical protein
VHKAALIVSTDRDHADPLFEEVMVIGGCRH